MLNMQLLKILVPRFIIANILFIVTYYGLAISIITPGLSSKNATSNAFLPEFLLKMNIMFFPSWIILFLSAYFSSRKKNRNIKSASIFSDIFIVIPPIAMTFKTLMTGREIGISSYADSVGDIVTGGYLTEYGYDLYQRMVVDVAFFAIAYVTLSFLTDRSRTLWGSEQ